MTAVASPRRWFLVSLAMLLMSNMAWGTESFAAITLTPPRAARTQEAIWLKVIVGLLPRGSRLLVNREDGQLVGTIASFGQSGRAPRDYVLPIARDIAGG